MFILSLFLLSGIALAQVRSSAITGTVTDATGAVIQQAVVVVTNDGTNVAAQTQTNTAGEYTVPYLAAGQYSVAVSAQGFQPYRKTGIVIGTSTTLRVDASLVPGSVTTAIEVRADAAVLQTEAATVQGAVNSNIISSIPNVNNNPLYYATLQAGVVPDPRMYSGSVLGVGYQDRQYLSSLRINGNVAGSGDIQLDGISVQGAAWHELAVLPNRDSLQEVRVSTSNFSAETGNALGVISMTTKSGTNDFHGTLSYRLRNEALNANGLYNNAHSVKRTKYRVNEGGGSIGGPVIIPKVFNGKDRLFFFASFLRVTHSDPATLQTYVPTALERIGDFSQTKVAGNDGSPVAVQIFDPFSAVPYNGSTQVFQRTPYPNGVITTPNRYGLKYLGAYPQPNSTPTDPYGSNNYKFTGTTPIVRNSFSSRLDFRLNDKNSIYMTGGISNGARTPPNMWGEDAQFVYSSGAAIADDNPYVAIGDTITLNPTTVLDVRYGITRVHSNTIYPSEKRAGFEDYSAWGMPSAVAAVVPMPGAAVTALNFGGPIANLNPDTWNWKKERQTNHALNASLTKIMGKWTIKAGGEFRGYLGNWQDIFSGTPRLTAVNHNGQLGNINGGNSGLITDPALRGVSFASALTGVGYWYLYPGTALVPALRATYTAGFLQGDWKATNRLTLNLGVRYEVQPGPTERYNSMAGFDLTRTNPFTEGKSLLNSSGTLGRLAFPGQDGYSRNLWDTQWNNLVPRIGVAYRLKENTVLRGGFGRTYAPSNTGFNANGMIYGTGPYSAGTIGNDYGTSPNGVPVGQFQDPINTIVNAAPGATQSPVLYGTGSSGEGLFLRTNKNAYLDQWNFFIEHNFGHAWLVSVGYVGSHGENQHWNGHPFTGTFAIPSNTLRSWRSDWINSNGLTDPGSVRVANPLPELVRKAAGAINSSTITTLNAMQPYLSLLGMTYHGYQGVSNYNALQFRAEHAYSNGLQMQMNYSWSKATGIMGPTPGYSEQQIGNLGKPGSGGIDYAHLENNHGYLLWDITHRFAGVVSYELPTGKGKALDPGNKVLRALIGEWQVASVITLQSGQPFGPSCGNTVNGRCIENPNEPIELPKNLQGWYDGNTQITLPSGRVITPTRYNYMRYNPDRFTAPIVQFPNGRYSLDTYAWGTTAKFMDYLRTPYFANVNLTLSRKFRIVEKVHVDVAAEATNLFNRTNFAPGGTISNVGVTPALTATPATNSRVGNNTNVVFGAQNMSYLYEPRQITLSARLQF
ncbi:MAG: TonB-dependent receptor [Bryobacteraceae bacterium]